MTTCKVFYIVLLVLCLPDDNIALRFGSIEGSGNIFNYSLGESWCNPSFECDIISYLCQELTYNGSNDDAKTRNCSLTVFSSPEDRATSLQEGLVDIVVGRFSVTPKRIQHVTFVRPFYLQTGAQIFIASGNNDDYYYFTDVVGLSVCMDKDYYAASALAMKYDLTVIMTREKDIQNKIKNGYCVVGISDDILNVPQMFPSEEEVAFKAPYAVAISKDFQSGGQFYEQIQDVLLKMFTQDNNQPSLIQQLEQKYLIDIGIPQSKELQELSTQITNNEGMYIGETAEDEIWGADNLVVSKSSLQENAYNEPCQTFLEVVLEGYRRGDPLEDLPWFYIDMFHYTFIVDITNQNEGIAKVVQHPFFQKGALLSNLSLAIEDIVSYDKTPSQVYDSLLVPDTCYQVVNIPLSAFYSQPLSMIKKARTEATEQHDIHAFTIGDIGQPIYDQYGAFLVTKLQGVGKYQDSQYVVGCGMGLVPK